MEQSPWTDSLSVSARYPTLQGKVLQVKMRGQYVKVEGQRIDFYTNPAKQRAMRPSPYQRALRQETLNS